jgi:O-acetyl-ADP-ribose deacetylase (regulator of RNase III)
MNESRVYQFGRSRLTLQFGDITKSEAQVIVSSDDNYLTMGGGVSAAILRAGGNAIALDASKKVPAAVGDVVVTTAGTLSAQYIFHAVTIGPDDSNRDHETVIRKTTERCMQLLDTLNLQSIAFPAIGAGVAGFPYDEVAVHMAEIISGDLAKRNRPVEATLFLFDRYGRMQPMDFVRFFEEFASRAPRLSPHELQDDAPQEPPIAASTAPATAEEIRSQRLQNLRRLISALEGQRFKLEERLIELLGESISGPEIAEVREKLRGNEELRLGYFTELKNLATPAETSGSVQSREATPLTVFVSSTSKDLEAYRAEIKDQIARRDLLFRGMEHFGGDPNNRTPAKRIVDEVRSASIYLGVFGFRYGSIDAATGISMTELEFNEAEASGKPMLLYVIRDTALVRGSDVEQSPEGKTKLDALKARILSDYTPYLFSSVEDLARQVYEDLGKPVPASPKAGTAVQ